MAKKSKKVNPAVSDLEKQYRKLAKRADQRLVRLEGLRHYKDYQGVTEYAYRVAMRDIASWSGAGQKRFNTKPPTTTDKSGKTVTNERLLKQKIADIEKFLESPTSTRKGIDSIMKKRAETTNKALGVDFTWQEWGNFWEIFDQQQQDEKFNYRAAAKVLYQQKIENNESLRSSVKKNKGKLQREEKLDKIEKATEKRLQENNITFADLIKS